jgi:hypothetical protein
MMSREKWSPEALTFLPNKWQTPRESVHKVGQPIRVWRAIELSDVQYVRFILEDCSLVVIHVKIIWSREKCHDGWETCRAGLPVHTVSARLIKLKHDTRENRRRTQHLALRARG